MSDRIRFIDCPSFQALLSQNDLYVSTRRYAPFPPPPAFNELVHAAPHNVLFLVAEDQPVPLRHHHHDQQRHLTLDAHHPILAPSSDTNLTILVPKYSEKNASHEN
jgi:hypothetical protein